MNWLLVDKIIKTALKEDIPYKDITTSSVISQDSTCTVDLISKDNGILAGIDVFKRVFEILGNVSVESFKNDGQPLTKGEVIAVIQGNTRNILMGERVALNLLQRMCGIATLTNTYVHKVEGTKAKIADTRKTTPTLRLLDKYSVTIGGGINHRSDLSDGVLIKDNHIAAAGSISNAITNVRNNVSFVRKIEVETEDLAMVKEAIDNKADIIMLDNMSIDEMKKAVEMIGDSAIIEASGNMSLDTVYNVALTGVNIISVGALTHSFNAFDISMKNLKIK